MNVNDIVEERIEAARRRIALRKRQRAELAEARRYGLQARKRAKMRRRHRDGS